MSGLLKLKHSELFKISKSIAEPTDYSFLFSTYTIKNEIETRKTLNVRRTCKMYLLVHPIVECRIIALYCFSECYFVWMLVHFNIKLRSITSAKQIKRDKKPQRKKNISHKLKIMQMLLNDGNEKKIPTHNWYSVIFFIH